MQLYEEYKEYEQMWEESSELLEAQLEADLDATQLDEGFVYWLLNGLLTIVQDIIRVAFKVIEVAVDLGVEAISLLIKIAWQLVFIAMKVGVFGWSVIEETICLVVSGLIQGVKAALETVVTLFEGLDEDAKTDKLVAAFANFKVEELAKKDPMLQQDLQNLYVELGPDKARELITKMDALVQRYAEPLAKGLKKVNPKDLEACRDKIREAIKKRVEKEKRKLQKQSAQDNELL